MAHRSCRGSGTGDATVIRTHDARKGGDRLGRALAVSVYVPPVIMVMLVAVAGVATLLGHGTLGTMAWVKFLVLLPCTLMWFILLICLDFYQRRQAPKDCARNGYEGG